MSEINKFELDNQVRYRQLFEGQAFDEGQQAQVKTQALGARIMADALRGAATAAIAVQSDTIDETLPFVAPSGVPGNDQGYTTLAAVMTFLSEKYEYDAFGTGQPLEGQRGATSLEEAIDHANQLNKVSFQESSRLSHGASSGINVVDGQFFMNGQAIQLEDIYVAIKVNQTYNHQIAIKDMTLEVEQRTKELRQAQDFLQLLSDLMPRNSDHKFNSWTHHDYFQDWDKYGIHEDIPTGQTTNIKIGVRYDEVPYWNLNHHGTPEWINIHWIPEGERKSLHSIFSDFQSRNGLNELPIHKFTDETFGDALFSQLDFKKWVQDVKSHISKLKGDNEITKLNLETHYNQLNESVEQMNKVSNREHTFMSSINRNL